jgi:V/A-type H+-transporting ATPase subunit I
MVGAIVGGLGKMLLDSQGHLSCDRRWALAVLSALLIIVTPMLQAKSKIEGISQRCVQPYMELLVILAIWLVTHD